MRTMIRSLCLVTALTSVGLPLAFSAEPPATEPPAKAAAWLLWDSKETVAEYAKRAGLEPTLTLDLTEKVKLELVLIPAGKFLMGSPETEKERHAGEVQHEVTISKPFYMGKYEVTQEQYEAVMEQNPSQSKGARLPVENVRWDEAQEFCKRASRRSSLCWGAIRKATEAEVLRTKALIGKLGAGDFDARQNAELELAGVGTAIYPFLKELLANPEVDLETKTRASVVLDQIRSEVRLPTEAQWEYACRAGTKTRFCSGDTEADLGVSAWYTGNSGKKTRPAGSKKPNAWGLYDLHGNVMELCQDFMAAYEEGALVDPKGPATGEERGVRGGCWLDDPRCCRSASRGWRDPDGRCSSDGFRLVLDVK